MHGTRWIVAEGPPSRYIADVEQVYETQSKDERLANARLIAKAPEMLELLKELVQALRDVQNAVAPFVIGLCEGDDKCLSCRVDTLLREVLDEADKNTC